MSMKLLDMFDQNPLDQKVTKHIPMKNDLKP